MNWLPESLVMLGRGVAPLIWLPTLIAVLGGVGMWLLLPHKHGWAKPKLAHALGGGLAAIALGLFAASWTAPGEFLISAFFYVFAATTLIAAALMIASKDPVHSALWFALVILSSSGLMLLAGGAFLAAGTIIVYAGAIIVMFLFAIMLAQQEGRAIYDRMTRSPKTASCACFMLLWALVYALSAFQAGGAATAAGETFGETKPSFSPPLKPRPGWAAALNDPRTTAVLERSSRPAAQLPTLPPPADPKDPNRKPQRPPRQVASLSATLFTDHLIAVEFAAVLLFVSMIGAVALVVSPGRTARQEGRSGSNSPSSPQPSANGTSQPSSVNGQAR